MKRLTLDLDDCSREYALLRVKQLQDLGSENVFIRESSGGKGFHVEAWIKDSNLSEYHLRAVLGDDPLRLWKDFQQSRLGIPSTQVLFDKKHGREAGEWVSYGNP